MLRKIFRPYFLPFLTGFGILFTFALLAWWVIFGFRQLDLLKSLGIEEQAQVLRHQRMLIYEGITLFCCLFLGASFLLYLLYREKERVRERKDFLSAFTHDLKTSISIIRLKLEKLKEEVASEDISELRLIGNRLSTQLQNALEVSYLDNQELILEKVNLVEIVDVIRGYWPGLSLTFKSSCGILADKWALRSILSNIFQNAVDHGNAKTLNISERKVENRAKVEIMISSDGTPIKVTDDELKTGDFQRKSSEGSGLGLKISKNLMKRMGGDIRFSLDKERRLVVILQFRESL